MCTSVKSLMSISHELREFKRSLKSDSRKIGGILEISGWQDHSRLAESAGLNRDRVLAIGYGAPKSSGQNYDDGKWWFRDFSSPQLIPARRNIADLAGNANFRRTAPWPFVSVCENVHGGIDPCARATGKSMPITVNCTKPPATLNRPGPGVDLWGVCTTVSLLTKVQLTVKKQRGVKTSGIVNGTLLEDLMKQE